MQCTWLTYYTIFFAFVMGHIGGWVSHDSYRIWKKIRRKRKKASRG